MYNFTICYFRWINNMIIYFQGKIVPGTIESFFEDWQEVLRLGYCSEYYSTTWWIWCRTMIGYYQIRAFFSGHHCTQYFLLGSDYVISNVLSIGWIFLGCWQSSPLYHSVTLNNVNLNLYCLVLVFSSIFFASLSFSLPQSKSFLYN